MSTSVFSYQFFPRAFKVHGDKYDYSKVNFTNAKKKVVIICPIHGEFLQRPFNHIISKQGCPKCGYAKCNKNNTTVLSVFIDNAKIVHGSKYDYSLVRYKNTNHKVIIVCDAHGQFLQTPHNHLQNHGCPKCALELKSKILSFSNDEFCEQAKSVHKNKYLYNKVNYVNRKTKIIVTCLLHGDFKTFPTSHLMGYGCRKCSNTHQRTNDEFINECAVIHNRKYDYSLVDFKTTASKVTVICPNHGKFTQTASHHLMGLGCIACNESKGEKSVARYLREFNIQSIRQYRFDDCRNKYRLPFDFYLPDFNVCIEYDGLQHFQPNKMFGGDKAFALIQKNDMIKNDYCASHNIGLLRIKYTEIKNIKKIIYQYINSIKYSA